MSKRSGLDCIALDCVVMYCTVLYCTVLHCFVLYCSIDKESSQVEWFGIVTYRIVSSMDEIVDYISLDHIRVE